VIDPERLRARLELFQQHALGLEFRRSRVEDVIRLLGEPTKVRQTPPHRPGSGAVTMTFLEYVDAPFLRAREWRNVDVVLWTGLWLRQLSYTGPRQLLARERLASALGHPDQVSPEDDDGGLASFFVDDHGRRLEISGSWTRPGGPIDCLTFTDDAPPGEVARQLS
jgi:hypothetical protein